MREHTTMKRPTTLAALAAAALMIAACGGGDDSADTTGTSIVATTAGGAAGGATSTTASDETPASVEVPIEGMVTFGAFDIELTGGVIESEAPGAPQTLTIDAKVNNLSDSSARPNVGEIALDLPDDESAPGNLDADEVPGESTGNGQLVFTLPTEPDVPFDESLLDEARIVMGAASVNQAIVSFADGVEASLEPLPFDPITGLSLDAPPSSNGNVVGATLELEQVEIRLTDPERNSGLEAGSGLLVLTGTYSSNSDEQVCANLSFDDSSVELPDGTAAVLDAFAEGCNTGGSDDAIELTVPLPTIEAGDYTLTPAITANGQGDPTTGDPIVFTIAAEDLDGVLAPA